MSNEKIVLDFELGGLFIYESELILKVYNQVFETNVDIQCGESEFSDIKEKLYQFQQKDPETVKAGVEQIIFKHNDLISKFTESYPLSADVLWQDYRRNMIRTIASPFLKEDQTLVKILKNGANMVCKEIGDKFIPLDIEPKYELLEFNPDRALGVGVYKFEDDRGIKESIWDLRQKEIPKLNYKG